MIWPDPSLHVRDKYKEVRFAGFAYPHVPEVGPKLVANQSPDEPGIRGLAAFMGTTAEGHAYALAGGVRGRGLL